MAGLSCADVLRDAGHTVTLFDKARGPGGRMSTRRLQTSLGEVTIDHGAQYFTARDSGFEQLVASWADLGIAARWPEAGPDAWVGTPTMNAIVKRMACAHAVEWGHLVRGVVCKNGEWWLTGETGETGPFDSLVLAIPAEQAAAILSLHDFSMTRIALMARSQPCWTGMFVFDRKLDGTPSIIRDAGDMAWAARNSAKPGRAEPETWVVQASAPWSSANLEASADDVAVLLLAGLSAAAGIPIPKPIAALAHRWRYALSAGTGHGALWNRDLRLGVCGDWLLGPRIECAWLSGRMLAQRCLSVDELPAGLPQEQQQVASFA